MLHYEFFVNDMELLNDTELVAGFFVLFFCLFFQHFAKTVQFTGPALKHCNFDIHHLCHMPVI